MEEYRVLLATEPSSSPFNVFCCYDKILKDNHKEEGGLFVGFSSGCLSAGPASGQLLVQTAISPFSTRRWKGKLACIEEIT